jgi:hypothetical protein
MSYSYQQKFGEIWGIAHNTVKATPKRPSKKASGGFRLRRMCRELARQPFFLYFLYN